MIDPRRYLARSVDVNTQITGAFQKRMWAAREHLVNRIHCAASDLVSNVAKPRYPWEFWNDASSYATDWVQRQVLFWDTMRERGNVFIEHERAGEPPVLHFKYEMVLDARKFERPVNYALIRILPPAGVSIDPLRRPYIIIDPRAGHGPGIGGFKDDSEVGVVLREGHQVYFVIFFPWPQPGQTLLDVTAAERDFVHKVRQLHPDSPKPVLVGNCQGGWATMILAATMPDDIGPVVIVGAPMSYWAGAWHGGECDNPMRYAAGLLAGTWTASLLSDLGNGIFDGAWLVQNFENLNPAENFWGKYYNLFANVDTEPPRFLEFERWWGGYFLLNREEMEWMTENLFIGNKLRTGGIASADGHFDLRRIKSPIVLFASLGDNITPPQQAFNWVADVYKSTEEIQARGQVIVGLMHRDVGHLGIFVSGRVARREQKEIVSVLKSIEAMPPGIYGMEILDKTRADGNPEYDVQFQEFRLEEIHRRLNPMQRIDEKPFEVVNEVSDFVQHGYELFARPMIQAVANEPAAELGRKLHPLRVQHWALSDMNPWLAWMRPMAGEVKAQRRPLGPESPSRQCEHILSELISGSLDLYRDLRDALAENLFYRTYGNLFLHYFERQIEAEEASQVPIDARELPFVKETLASMAEGGYPEALARIIALLAQHGAPIPLAQFELERELAEKYAAFLPAITPEQQRRIRGEQDIIVHYESARALETLPHLLAQEAVRKKLTAFLDRLAEDERFQEIRFTPAQMAILKRVRRILAVPHPGQKGTSHSRRLKAPQPA